MNVFQKGRAGQKTIPAQGGNILKLPGSGNRTQELWELKSRLYAKYGVISTPGYLRLEYNLGTASLNQIQWTTTEQGANSQPNPAERRLKLSDTFTAMGWSFHIGIAAAAAPTAAQLAQMRLYTYPNPVQITAPQAANYETLYNGFISLRVDTTVFIDSYPMRNFYRVATSQQGVGAATGVTGVSRDEWPNMMYGMNSITPSFELNGQGNIQLSASLPATFDPSLTNQAGIAVLQLQGYLHQGGANNQKQVQAELRNLAG